MLPMEQAANAIKRLDLPTAEEAQSLLDAAEAHVGRPVRVFRRPATVPADDSSKGRGKQAEAPVPGPAAAGDEEGDSFYDFTPEDYARAVVRVQMPDGLVLEAAFAPSDAISVVHDTLAKCLATQQEPFYLYTAPPKQRLTDPTQTLYDAGLAPGALVYFAHDPPPGADMRTWEERGPYLRQDLADLCDLHLQAAAAKEGSAQTAAAAAGSDAAAEGESRRPGPEPGQGSSIKPATTKPGSGKPKWLKL
eukprot:SM000019S05051  [mRNA]  locus=s19:610617:612293:- [translate_table: standard]